MTNKEQAEKIINKYLKGKANAKERKLIDDWYYSFGPKASRDQKTREGLEQEMFQEIKAHISQPEKATLILKFLPYLKYAAIILLVTAFGITTWIWSSNQRNTEQYMITSTINGQTKQIVLSDGSKILLSPLSQVKYPARFKSDKRSVELLQGQAFFDVHHEEKRPFRVVLPNGLYTHVLGTSFTIRAFRQSKTIDVDVNSGKVAIGNQTQVFGILVKGEQLSYDKNTRTSKIGLIKVPLKELIFSNSTMLEVFGKLQSTYNIRINLQQGTKLKQQKFTGTFTTNQQPEKILWLLSRIHHFKIDASEDNKTFKIFKN